MTSKLKSAFITGGSKGIGYAVAQSLIEEGYRVTITSRDQQEIEAAAQQLGEGTRGVVCDVRDLAAVDAAVKGHAEAFGGLDVLFVNAGVGKFAPIQDLSAEDWQAVIDTNLTGAFFTVKAAVPYLKDSQGYVITLFEPRRKKSVRRRRSLQRFQIWPQRPLRSDDA